MSERPRRAFTLSIEISGDTWEAVLSDLDYLAGHIKEHGPTCKSVMGGCDSGHIVTITHLPDMTHDRYMDELSKYLEKQR